MAAVTDPGPGGRGPDPRLRAVAVVALLCVAAVALRARQGLDWEQLADPVAVRWARVLLGAVLLLVLATLAAAFYVVSSLTPPPAPPLHAPGPDPHRDVAPPSGGPDTRTSWTVLVLVSLVLAGSALATRWAARRQQAGTAEPDPEGSEQDEVDLLVA